MSTPAHTCQHFVLVVDDQFEIRETLKEILEDEGYEVGAAGNGREALVVLQDASPCLILLDLMMPVMNGWELASRLKHDPTLSGVPVVLVSGSGEVRAAAESLGMDYLEKPVDLGRLLSMVQRHCGPA